MIKGAKLKGGAAPQRHLLTSRDDIVSYSTNIFTSTLRQSDKNNKCSLYKLIDAQEVKM